MKAEGLPILQFMQYTDSSAQACQCVANTLTWGDHITSDRRLFNLHDLLDSLLLWQECEKKGAYSVSNTKQQLHLQGEGSAV